MPPPRQFFLDACYICCDRGLIFCSYFFSTFLHKVCKWQLSMTFGCWSMILFSRLCNDPFNATAHCCGSFQLYFDTYDKSSYLWRFNCKSAAIQMQLLVGDPRTGHMTSLYMTSLQVTKTFTSITPHRIKVEPWARYHCVCTVKRHRLTSNMTYPVHSSGQAIWPDLRLNFQIDLFGSTCLCFDASRRGEYDGFSRFPFIS